MPARIVFKQNGIYDVQDPDLSNNAIPNMSWHLLELF